MIFFILKKSTNIHVPRDTFFFPDTADRRVAGFISGRPDDDLIAFGHV